MTAGAGAATAAGRWPSTPSVTAAATTLANPRATRPTSAAWVMKPAFTCIRFRPTKAPTVARANRVCPNGLMGISAAA